MQDQFLTKRSAPQGFLFGAGALIAAALVMTLVARQTDIGTLRTPPPTAIQTVDLRFEDRTDGAIVVRDANSDRLLKVVTPGTDGFVRVAMRSLAFERKTQGATNHTPVRLGLKADGGFWLQDLATGRTLHLDAYGRANALTFAQFLEPGRLSR